MSATINTVRSSLPLQILLCISNRFSVVYFIIIVICYGIKISQLVNALHVQVPEIIIIILFVPLEFMRISFGQRGNLTETPSYISFSILLSIPVIAVCIYLAFFQANVFLIERILSCIQTGLIILESIIALATAALLSKGSISE